MAKFSNVIMGLVRRQVMPSKPYNGTKIHPLLKCDIEPVRIDYEWPQLPKWPGTFTGIQQELFDEKEYMNKKYEVILADPPWKQSKGGKKNKRPKSSGMGLDYPTLSLKDIESILRACIKMSKPNHILFLWTIEKYLHQAEELGHNLGYKLHSRMIWNKVTGIPAAFTIRFGHEYLLYMYKGTMLPVSKNERGKIHSVFTEQVKGHSQKPEISYEIIERLFPSSRKIELFSRANRKGWDCWGNEIKNDVEIPLEEDYEQDDFDWE